MLLIDWHARRQSTRYLHKHAIIFHDLQQRKNILVWRWDGMEWNANTFWWIKSAFPFYFSVKVRTLPLNQKLWGKRVRDGISLLIYFFKVKKFSSVQFKNAKQTKLKSNWDREKMTLDSKKYYFFATCKWSLDKFYREQMKAIRAMGLPNLKKMTCKTKKLQLIHAK